MTGTTVDSSLTDALRADPRFDAVAHAIGEGKSRFLGGLWGASAHAVAGLLAERVRRRALLVVETLEIARDAVDDLATLGLGGGDALLLPPLRTVQRRDAGFDPDAYAERLAVLRDVFMNPHPRLIVAPVRALFGPMVTRDAYKQCLIRVRPGDTLDVDPFVQRLLERGFLRVPRVESAGEIAVRGDVIDVFPWGADRPIRIELFDDEVEEIREFDAETQRSTTPVLAVRFPALRTNDFRVEGAKGARALLDFLPKRSLLLLREVDALMDRVSDMKGAETALFGGETAAVRVRLHGMPLPPGAGIINFKTQSVEALRRENATPEATVGLLTRLLGRNERVHVFVPNDVDRERLAAMIAEHAAEVANRILIEPGRISTGFQLREARIAVVSHRELVARERDSARPALRRGARAIKSAPIREFFELKSRDYVVHATHGIGRYLGIEKLERNGVSEEFLVIEYRDDARLYVPVAKIELVQKYIGAGDEGPKLHRLGGTRWRKTKDQVELAVLDLASELLDLQATRERAPGHAFPPDDSMQTDFEGAFPYEDTPDQTDATRAVKADMESPRPMDRLICGDVGFGKTEVAVRAIFKAVAAGKQVAMLVPTTVLAQQHFHTIGDRMRGFAVRVEVLSRFRTPKEQRVVVEDTERGRVDVLIGTHRIASDDVKFKDLGLVVIDEEQRFGVEHKQFFKRLRATADVLTMSATPIPRTLHLSMIKVRDISSIRTPPPGRMRIRTEVVPWDSDLVRKVLLRELEREGQAFFVHNRVRGLDRIAAKLRKLVPEARCGVVHGQMSASGIEDVMVAFVEHEIDVLVCTTIVESGLDIPNANTVIINEADRLGLSELHQLRGRVGRHHTQAYAYLIPRPGATLNEDSRRRLKAVEEFSDLGAGFQIAIRDLEIRGAGNILGAQQSGHMASVGYEMYCRLLRSAIKRFANEVEPVPPDVDLDLRVPTFLDEAWLGTDPKVKMDVLRLLGGVRDRADRDDVLGELRDRFGDPPPEVFALAEMSRIQHGAAAVGIETVARSGEVDGVLFVFRTEVLMTHFLGQCGGRAKFLKDATLFASFDGPRDPEAFLEFVIGLLTHGGARV